MKTDGAFLSIAFTCAAGVLAVCAPAVAATPDESANVAYKSCARNVQADLGIAVTKASDVARETADVLLLKSDIEAIPEALGISQATLRTIKQNLFWAFFLQRRCRTARGYRMDFTNSLRSRNGAVRSIRYWKRAAPAPMEALNRRRLFSLRLICC